jgi:hypothetical protein
MCPRSSTSFSRRWSRASEPDTTQPTGKMMRPRRHAAEQLAEADPAGGASVGACLARGQAVE